MKNKPPFSRASISPYADGSRFKGKQHDEIFREIEGSNYWIGTESVSGSGSTIDQTRKLVDELPGIFKKLSVKSIIDIPCGDFNWMKKIKWGDIKYTGADIVKNLVDNNNKVYSKENVRFVHLNLITDPLPRVDLIFCRDCLVHFSFADIVCALTAVVKSESSLFMTTTFPDEPVNADIPTGGWRPLDFQKAPFHFPQPRYLLNEGCTEFNEQFSDKSLGIWNTEDLASHI